MFKSSWRFRSPPENTGILEMCQNPQNCLFGNACTRAHSNEELLEWRQCFSYQLHHEQRSVIEKRQLPRSKVEYIRNLVNESRKFGLEPKNVLTEVSGGQSILCKQNLFVTHLDKNKEISWQFIVKTANVMHHNGPIEGLKHVFFLETDSSEFSFHSISLVVDNQDKLLSVHGNEISLANYTRAPVMRANITVKFFSSSYGHFNVAVIFDFGLAPRLVRYLGVVVAPEKHLFEKLALSPTTSSDEKNNELTWMQKYKLVSFDESNTEEDLADYSLPANLRYGVEYGAFEYLDVNLTPENYRDRLHNLLFVEEYERRKLMSRLNVQCHDIFALFRKRTKLPSLRTVNAEKALFIPVPEETLEEVGILVTRGSKALIRLRQFMYGAADSEDFVVHEALVITILSGEIVLEISSKTLTLLKSMSSPVAVDICFRFVNTFLCMHSAIDRVDLDLIFYTPQVVENTRDHPLLHHSVLSHTQATALSRIIYSPSGAPVLLLGPFGTGKTQTLAEAVKMLILQPNNSQRCRILICTHSNSAADHYIEDYLDPFFKDTEEGDLSCEKPLRLYWEHRLATSISDTMLPYCIMDLNTGTFRNPSLEELARKTIVVTTLVTADMLVKCGVKPGFFTHIFIDEAAQAMELETLIPISLATEKTKVVLAGDHLQLSPPVFSPIGRKLLLDKSLLVRLYESYPANSPRKILLVENFRSYSEIVNIPSKLFYEGSLISKKELPSDLQYPVKFYGVHGLDEKASDSPSYVNMSEVAEITERVEEMVNTWPEQHFGELKLESICVLSAHHAQIRQIRRELRVIGFSNVRVENVNNVQGLEFDVLFLSTVRTSRMLGPGQHEGKDLGFLSNPKLLNTAITRAKFCLIVIGDPKALCSVGDCRICWKTILSLCSENGTFHHRVSLVQVLDSIREEMTQTAPSGGLQQPYPQPYLAPQIPANFTIARQPWDIRFLASVSSPLQISNPILPTKPFAHPYPLPQPYIQANVSSHPKIIEEDIVMGRNAHSHILDTSLQKAPLAIPPVYQSQIYVSAPPYGRINERNTNSGKNALSQGLDTPQTISVQRATLPTSPLYKSQIQSPVSFYGRIIERARSSGKSGLNQRLNTSPSTSLQQDPLPTPQHYQSPICVAATSYGGITESDAVDERNAYSQSLDQSLSVVPQKASVAIPPANISQMTVSTYSQIIGKDILGNAQDQAINMLGNFQNGTKSELSPVSDVTSPLLSSRKPRLLSLGDATHRYSNFDCHSGHSEKIGEAKSMLHADRDLLKTKESHAERGTSGDIVYYSSIISEQSQELSLPNSYSSFPAKTSEKLPIASLCRTIRQNIVHSLRNITDSEEALSVFIENALEDTSAEIQQNLAAQLSLLREQKSSLEKQQVLNKTLAKSIHSLQETNKTIMKDHEEIPNHSFSSSRLNRSLHVQKISLDNDDEVQEWHRLRRQDPIVQDYIKSFEILLERARTRDRPDDQTAECCDITSEDNSNLAGTLRGWVLRPQSVVHPSGSTWYEKHLSEQEVVEKLEIGKLVPCVLRVEKSSSGESAICVVEDPAEKDILIPDIKSMNRAFHTDHVAVEITQDLEDQDVREGKVVAILQERHHRQFVCRLASPESSLMIPLNEANPTFSILQSDNHIGQTGVAVFDTQGEKIRFQHFVSGAQDKFFLVQFLKWDVSYRYPLGFVARSFDVYSTFSSLLPILYSDCGITNEFPFAVIEEVENSFPLSWQVPDVEFKSRCRYEDAFTIDTEGTTEVDHAISVRSMNNGIYCITVHVSDVSYFVKKGSLVDKAAQRQATSVYLPPLSTLAVPLLPTRLNHICSLLPGKERLSVSCEFVVDESGNTLQSPTFRRTIVVSQRCLSFKEVDGFLTGSQKMEPGSSPLLRSIEILHCLSRELWARRVRAGSFQACAKGTVRSHSQRIVEELLIMTNMAVAEKLSSFPYSHVVPFCAQQPPKYSTLQGLAAWAAGNKLNLRGMWLTQWFSGFEEQQSSHAVCVDLKLWRDICQAVKIDSMADLTEDILSVHKDSQLTTLIPRLKCRIPQSKYISSNEYSSTERRHFSLNADCYIHFTSPLRRYCDIVVHRVLFSETAASLYDEHEMKVLCNILNLGCGKAAEFSKRCAVVCEAESLQETDGWRKMIVEFVEGGSMTLKCEASETSALHNIKVNDMGASLCRDGVEDFVAFWVFHEVILSKDHAEHSSLDLQMSSAVPNHSLAPVAPHRTAHQAKHSHPLPSIFQQKLSPTSRDTETKAVLDIPAEIWYKLLQACKVEDTTAIVKSMEITNKHASVTTTDSRQSVGKNDDTSITIDDSGCKVVKRSFHCGDELQALFSSSVVNGLPQPLLQTIQVAADLLCCVRHHRQPAECFCELQSRIPERDWYSSIEEYQRVNIPLLIKESAERSVRDDKPTLHIKNALVKWTKDAANVVHGHFHVPADSLSPSTKLYEDDFVCVHSGTVIYHGRLKDVILVHNDHHVGLVLNLTKGLPDEDVVNIEIISQSLDHKRMITAVRNLPQATQNVRSLFLTRDLHSVVKSNRSKSKSFTSSFTLDPSQRKALDKAVHFPLTLIEGISGTGKTYIASAIAEQFYLENCRQKPTFNVLFCCPTNQAVNDAESILSRLHTIRLLRVYDRTIEAESFPETSSAYGVHPRSSASDSISRGAALHFRIRSNSNPFHKKIQKYTQQLSMLRESDNKLQFGRVGEEYKRLIDLAEEFELTECGANVILCTCIEAGSARIQNHGRIKQCIMDESHHSSEAMSLVVFQTLGERCERVVLLGNRIIPPSGPLDPSLFHSLCSERGKKRYPKCLLSTQHRIVGL